MQGNVGSPSKSSGSHQERVSASWGIGCLGTTGSVLDSMVTGDSGVNISLVDPTVLVSKTENLLV